LFLGGSAISLFEILDLLIYNAFVKLTTRRARPKVPNDQTMQEEQDSNMPDGIISERL